MTDLKELIEKEIDQYLEWPTADKSHVTTVSAKLFAEHMARLYADHIPEAAKKIGRRQIREVFLRNGARIEPDRDDLPDYVYESVFELMEMAAPAVQGEPVVFVSAESLGDHEQIGMHATRQPNAVQDMALYTALQPAERQPARRKTPMSYPNGLDMESMPGMVEPSSGHQQTEQQPAPDVSALAEALEMRVDMVEMDALMKESVIDSPLDAHRKQQEGGA